jgi:uncharacterized damage-inducible protein DinB
MDAKTILLAFLQYNHWANQNILRHVEQLSHPQLHATAKISYETTFDLLRHILDTEWGWRLIAAGQPAQSFLWEVEDLSDLPAIGRACSAEHTRLLDFVHALSPAGLQRQPNNSLTVWQILIHIANHSTHHRSELSRYLEACGHPIPEDELDFGTFINTKQ